MKNKEISVIAGLLLLLTGCSPYMYFDIEEDYADYLKISEGTAAGQKSTDGTIELNIIAPEKCGCHLEKLNEQKEIDESPAYQCIGFPLYDEDTKEEIKQIAKENKTKSNSYYVFDSFGEIAKTCLEQQLKTYFNEVQINLETPKQTDNTQGSSVTSYYTEWFKTDDKIIYTKLLAISNDGKRLEAYGKATDKMGNGHLAWLIPLGVITFPIGTMIGAIIVDNNFMALVNRTMIESIDLAAAELSKKLAEELAHNPDQQYQVYIMLE